ncbi:MAG: hypothetical protein AVDCRST_MAG28-2822, partial [uncultured Rubrobacteraceae bacterium]
GRKDREDHRHRARRGPPEAGRGGNGRVLRGTGGPVQAASLL